jgi:hypothetical protein
MELKTRNVAFKAVLLVTSYSLLVTTIGCDAFVRKFTRKPKKEEAPQDEMVLAPEEYKGVQMTKEELYRQSFLYWKSWQGELIESLSNNGNHKKQIACANEAIKNLESLKALLNSQEQLKLEVYIKQLKELRDSITQDVYGNNIFNNRVTAERIKMDILRNFSYKKIKDYLA